MLNIRDLSVVLDGYTLQYDLNVIKGECVAIQGASGVGKTTLLNMIAGFLKPESGAIFWDGMDICQLTTEQRPVSMLFQDHNLFEHLSVINNLQLGFDKEPPQQQILQACQALGITDQLEKMPPQLSGGQRQRVALIRTLLRPEPIVLLDEPFAELDPESRRTAALWTREEAKKAGKTLLLVTHQDEDVSLVADRAIRL